MPYSDAMPSGTRTISILLVADQLMFRDGLSFMLSQEPGFIVAGQFTPDAEAVKALNATRPALVLVDADPKPERAIEFVTSARRMGVDSRFLVVTSGVGDREAFQFIQNGVAGIIHKDRGTSDLISTIRQVLRGEFFLEPAYVGSVFRSLDKSRTPRRPHLTDRDRTVLRYVLQGLTNRAMADELEITEGAVKASMRQVCEKLGVRTRTQLVRVALEQYRDQL